MSARRRRQRRRPQMLPAIWPVQNTGPRDSGHLNGPQNTSDEEAQVALQARQNIQARFRLARFFQKYKAQLITNKYGVTVTSKPASTEEKICLTVYKNKKVVPITVENSGITKINLSFQASDLVKNIFTVRDCHGNIIKTIKKHPLEPGEAYKIKVHFDSEHAGFYEQLLVFKFHTCQQCSDKFEIVRLLEVIHRTSLDEGPPPKPITSLCDIHFTKGYGLTLLKHIIPLKTYAMPNNIGAVTDSDRALRRPLSWKNYSQRFHLLLHLEEHQQKTDIEKYNQDDVTLFRYGSNTDLFILKIAGAGNDTPVTLLGNQVRVTLLEQSGVGKKTTHKGWIQHADAEQVYLRFKEKFMNSFKEGMRLNVEFSIQRIALRVQHRAVALVYKHRLREVLFPTGQHSSHHSHLHRLSELDSNPEQRLAIQHILAATAKPAPYLVFGPPGTGKTVTLVEAIKQIVKTQASSNILACASSNSATDHLCEKILAEQIGEHMVYRFYALSCPVRNIPENTKFCCNLDHETSTLMIPPKMELMKYRIVVTTLITAARLVTGGIPPGHYSYIFVDEAGQAAETECVIPIAGLLNPQRCQVVLAGDPKQLGPILTSKMAEGHGLGMSLLERLMTNINLYQSHETYGFNNRFVTKLLRNYRSHPAILKIPNELFYQGQLQAYAYEEECTSYCKWEALPKKGFPLIFHGVAGTDEREGNSPSLFNMAEVEVLKEYLKALVDHLHKKGVTNIEPGEIGIIAPYRKQVEKIQNVLQMDKDLKKNVENVLVGTVEKFQGKEFNVILMSTVRSTPKLTAQKQRFTLGFVDNEKRFNVAITRARALLIVVGDPRVLKTDKVWNKFIHYCYKKGGYRGITCSDAEEEEKTLTNVVRDGNDSPNLSVE